MPAFMGPFVGFALGAALAWLGRREGERVDERSHGARVGVAALFALLVMAPVCAYFLIFTPDWAFAYLVDSRKIPSAVELTLVMLTAGAVVVGFIAAERAHKKRSFRALALAAGVPSAIALAEVLIFFPKLRIEGSFHQVESGFGTQSVAGTPLGYAILWMSSMLVLGFVLAVRALSERAQVEAPEEASPPVIARQTPSIVPGEPLLGRRSRSK